MSEDHRFPDKEEQNRPRSGGSRLNRRFCYGLLPPSVSIVGEILVRLIGMGVFAGVRYGMNVSSHQWAMGPNMTREYLLGNYAHSPPVKVAYSVKALAFSLVVPAVGLPLLMLALWMAVRTMRPSCRNIFTSSVHGALIELKRYVMGLTAAVISLLIWIEITKKRIGRPRPDFFYTCDPYLSSRSSYQAEAASHDLPPLDCSNPSLDRIHRQDATMSFPSGHAATSTCVYFYLALWVWRLFKSTPALHAPLIFSILLAMIFPAIISYSRITDNRHHPTDVLFGILFGLFFAKLFFWAYFQRSNQTPLATKCKTQLPIEVTTEV